ncbi:MAG TPA: hypothetical protein VEZ14_01970 [Dehalococcoidia bacterium]|nr:hypothetical protein [Dehalococcoidia bacterium]
MIIMHRTDIRRAALAAIAAAAMVLAACSGGGSATRTPTPALPTVAPTPLGIIAQQTQEAALYNPPLKEYIGTDRAFKISFPATWTYEALSGKPTPSSDAYVRDSAGNLLASISIQCFPGVTGTQVLNNDATGAKGTMTGDPRTGNHTTVPVLGGTGDQILWTGNLTNITIQHRSLYFTAGGCGWRLQLNTFPGAALENFDATWNRILASFQPGPV